MKKERVTSRHNKPSIVNKSVESLRTPINLDKYLVKWTKNIVSLCRIIFLHSQLLLEKLPLQKSVL